MIFNSGFVFTKYSNNETDIASCVTLFSTAYPSRFIEFVLSYKTFTKPLNIAVSAIFIFLASMESWNI